MWITASNFAQLFDKASVSRTLFFQLGDHKKIVLRIVHLSYCRCRPCQEHGFYLWVARKSSPQSYLRSLTNKWENKKQQPHCLGNQRRHSHPVTKKSSHPPRNPKTIIRVSLTWEAACPPPGSARGTLIREILESKKKWILAPPLPPLILALLFVDGLTK